LQIARNGYLVTFGIHALDVRIIVSALHAIGGAIGSTGSCHATNEQTTTGTDASTLMTIDQGTGSCADHCTYSGATQTGIDAYLVRVIAALHLRILTACHVVHTKFIEVFSGAR
jgi:hypothetical protein